jgi:hypothetical protein
VSLVRNSFRPSLDHSSATSVSDCSPLLLSERQCLNRIPPEKHAPPETDRLDSPLSNKLVQHPDANAEKHCDGFFVHENGRRAHGDTP